MQGLHLLIATTTVYLFVRFAPFSLLQRLLFSFGYFPFYEYSVICRSYGLSLAAAHGILLSAIPRRDRQVYFDSFHAGSAVPCTRFGLIVATGSFRRALARSLYRTARNRFSRCSPWSFYAGSALFLLGVVTAVIQIRPPADTGWAVGWRTEPNYEALLSTGKGARSGPTCRCPRLAWNYWNNPLCVDGRFFPLNLICYLAVPGYVLFVFSVCGATRLSDWYS
jgi:hypothetical protein